MKKLLLSLLIIFMLAMPAHGFEIVNGVETVTGIAIVNPNIDGGSIDGTPIGQTTPAAGAFTQVKWAKGADVASANALTLGTDGNYFDITGTTAITSIGTLGVGTQVCLHFDGVLTLTHQATDLILPSGANITTAAGDEALFIEYATGDWRCVNYSKANGEALVGATASDTAYDAGTWDSNSDAATKNAIRDKIETLALESVLGTSIGNGLRLDSTVLKADREFRTLSFTNGASQTTFTEANMLAYSAINNQGAGEETDIILVAVSYPIKFAVETSEAFSIELCPPAGEIFTQDGTALDANDCILSSATVGSSFLVKRMQIADGTWQYFTYTIQGVNTDGGAAD